MLRHTYQDHQRITVLPGARPLVERFGCLLTAAIHSYKVQNKITHLPNEQNSKQCVSHDDGSALVATTLGYCSITASARHCSYPRPSSNLPFSIDFADEPYLQCSAELSIAIPVE